MPGWTNRGKARLLNAYFAAVEVPASGSPFRIALVTSATAPGPDTNLLSDLTEIAAGNGYTAGGASIERSTVGFDVNTEDDSADRGLIQVRDVVFTATGGPLPSSGNGARYAVLLDDDSPRNILAYWDLGADRTVSDGQPLTIQNMELRLDES